MRVATCTPVDFNANEHFFGRDSGLMCRGFQAAGHDCQVIMPGTRAPDDAPDLLRTGPGELESSDWWRHLKLDLVLLYAWGDPRFRSIAAAIRGAGISLVQNIDSAGIDSPYADFGRWWTSLSGMIAGPQPLPAKLRLIGRGLRDFVPAAYEKKRLAMMDESDWIATVSPPAGESIRSYARALRRPGVAAKVRTVPHPVSPHFSYTGGTKRKRVLCVGRWQSGDRHQKDPATLMRVAADFLKAREDWSLEIIGRGSGSLVGEIGEEAEAFGDRLILTEYLDRQQLGTHYLSSSILFCPSRYESFHISSAEGLCCGCSIVVADHPLLASTGWFTTRESGTLAASRTPSALLAALLIEAGAWESGKRSADAISSTWSADLHAACVAKHLLQSIQPVS